MNVHDEFTRRVAADRLCAAVMKAVRENDTAALGRLGMRGFAQYAGRLSELMTECARRRLLGADDFGAIMDEDEDDFGAIMDEDKDDFGAIMGEVAKPTHYAHHLVNEGGTAIQQALDRRNGVRLRVIEPEFNDGRLKGIVGEASESDSENAADNLAVQLGTFVKDMGNEFMRQNAEQRDRAGFKVTITRTGGAKCCPWCADRTGKWELANAPDGVFGCHDNCKCVVDYTNSKGTVRGRAVTHKIDGKTVTKWEFADKIPYTPPRVLTKEEAAARGGFDKPKRLTGGANGGIIGYTEDNSTAGFTPAKTKEEAVRFAQKFARSVNYDGITLLNINQINETLNYLIQKYPTLMLDEITNKSKAVMNANWHHLEIRGSKLGKTLSDEAAIFAKEQELRKAKLTALKEKYSDGTKIPWRVEREIEKYERALKFKRYGVHSSYKNHVKAVTTHEYGHIIADQYFGMMNTRVANPNYDLNRRLEGMRRRWDEAFKKSRENGDIYNLSMYADENVYEFFAESFLAREMGEQLPDYVESLMKEVLDNGIM